MAAPAEISKNMPMQPPPSNVPAGGAESLGGDPRNSPSQPPPSEQSGGSAAAQPPPAEIAGGAAPGAAAEPAEAEVDADLLRPPEYDLSRLLDYDEHVLGLADSTSCGLQNLGQTCYANAVLQSLACRQWFANHQRCAHADEAHAADCLLCALAADVTTLAALPSNEPFRPACVLRRAHWERCKNFRGHPAA